MGAYIGLTHGAFDCKRRQQIIQTGNLFDSCSKVETAPTSLAEEVSDSLFGIEKDSLTFSFQSTPVSGWNFQGTFTGTYSVFDYTYKGSLLHVQQAAGRINGSNSFSFGKGWTGYLSGWLKTPFVVAIQHFPWLGSVEGEYRNHGTKNGKRSYLYKMRCIPIKLSLKSTHLVSRATVQLKWIHAL